jgi:hypothetical protein
LHLHAKAVEKNCLPGALRFAPFAGKPLLLDPAAIELHRIKSQALAQSFQFFFANQQIPLLKK